MSAASVLCRLTERACDTYASFLARPMQCLTMPRKTGETSRAICARVVVPTRISAIGFAKYEMRIASVPYATLTTGGTVTVSGPGENASAHVEDPRTCLLPRSTPALLYLAAHERGCVAQQPPHDRARSFSGKLRIRALDRSKASACRFGPISLVPVSLSFSTVQKGPLGGATRYWPELFSRSAQTSARVVSRGSRRGACTSACLSAAPPRCARVAPSACGSAPPRARAASPTA